MTPIGVWTSADISALALADAELTNAWAGATLANVGVKAGRLEAISVKLTGDVGSAGNNFVATAYKNGVATTVTVTVTGGAGTEDEATATVTPVSFASLDDITVQAKRVGTPGAVAAVVTLYARLSSVSGTGDSVTLSGDVTGGSAANTVEKIQNTPIPAPTMGDDGLFIQYDDASGEFVYAAASGGGGGEANTASNVGVGGVGVFKQKTGVDLEFRNINAGSSKITVTLDAGNNEIDLDVDATATPTANKIPIADASGDLDAWVTYRPGGTDIPVTDGGTGASTATAGFDNLAPTTTTGDLIVHNGSDNIRVAVGTDGHVLTADSAQASGVKWAAAGGGTVEADTNYFRVVGTSPFERYHFAGQLAHVQLVTVSGATGTLRAFPFVAPRGGTVDRLAVGVTTGAGAGGVARWGIYQATSSSAIYPSALVVDAGEVDVTGNGVKAQTVSVTLTAGVLYWFVYLGGVSAATIRAINTAGCWPIFGYSNAFSSAGAANIDSGVGLTVAQAYGALPDPFPAAATIITAGSIPAIGARFSA